MTVHVRGVHLSLLGSAAFRIIMSGRVVTGSFATLVPNVRTCLHNSLGGHGIAVAIHIDRTARGMHTIDHIRGFRVVTRGGGTLLRLGRRFKLRLCWGECYIACFRGGRSQPYGILYYYGIW